MEWTIDHLRWFLEDVARRSGAQAIHLIAHSMGSRAVVDALDKMAAHNTAASRQFTHLILAAPDIDADIFRSLSGAFRGLVDTATLYASSNDKALMLSKEYQGYQRAGDTVPSVVIVPGFETIDVSAIDTGLLDHSYFGDSKSVITDLIARITDNQPAAKRRFLIPVQACHVLDLPEARHAAVIAIYPSSYELAIAPFCYIHP